MAILISEIAARRKWLPEIICRKLLHLFAGTVVLRIMTIVDNQLLLVIIGLSFTILLFVIIQTGVLKEINSTGRRSWGIVFFPLSFSILVFFFRNELIVAKISFAIMTFSDSFAAIFGILFAKKKYYLGTDKKSYLGSTIFFTTTILILSLYALAESFTFSTQLISMIFIVAFILTIIEAFSSKGSDNLFVPLFAAVLIKLVFINGHSTSQIDLTVGFVLALFTAVTSIRFKALTKDGAAVTFILAFIIYGFGGLKWTLPIFVFFVLSSVLSKIRHSRNKLVEERFEKSGNRDANQVLANGAFGLILVIANSFFPKELFYHFYVLYIASMCADTWGTEIGTFFKNKTYSIITFREVDAGVSGGVSLLGTLGSVAGALIIVLVSSHWIENVWMLLIIACLAFISSLIDSLLGSTIQVQYKCNICKLDTEKEIHCETKTNLYSGIKFFNNDVVNLSSGIVILLIFYLLILFRAI
jgi:uncharacterized protein (TIGR00297 family)